MYPITEAVRALFEAEHRKVLRITGKPLKKDNMSVGPSDIVTVNDAAAIPAKDITIGIEPVQSGSGDPSPTNVRPISGWTGARVTRCGTNFVEIDNAWIGRSGTHNGITWRFNEDGSMTLNGTKTTSTPSILIWNFANAAITSGYLQSDNKKHIPNGDYFIYSGHVKANVQVYGSNDENSGASNSYYIASGNLNPVRVTIDDTYKYNWIRLNIAGSAVFDNYTFYPMVRLASDTGTEYAPYTRDTYDITFPTEAGTVYGGTLNVTTGLLTVTHGNIASYNGESLPGKWISSMDVYSAGGTPTTGAQVVYELATPQTYQLTPTEVKLLLGENNVWADTGDMTLSYRPYADLIITDDDVLIDSFEIDRYSCNGEKLEIGTAIAAQMTFTLENGDGTYDGIVFENTELFAEVGVADWTQENPTVHWVPCGYFTPDMQPRRLSTISVTALDRMTKFDVVVDAADLTFPATIAGLVSQVCTLCGVTLAQSIAALTNANVTVTVLPSVDGEITYRNLIQWCAGIMGTNAWFDWNGQLRFSWYNNATGYVSTMDNRYSSDLFENDLTVTGVEYTNDSGIAIVEGTDDYAVDLTGNAIAGPLIATVLPPLNTALNGFTYRPFTAAVVNAPYLWPMDVVTFTDKNGNNHTSALTNVAFGLNGTTALESKGMTYAINKAAQPKEFTREQARLINAIAQKAITKVDVEYAQNQSTTVAPTDGWSTDAPQWQDGYYIWQRTATTTDGGTTYSAPTCISGRDGADGQRGPQGPQGATGVGVSGIVEQYYLSTSNTTQTGGSWGTTQPAWVSGKYIWTRSQVTWTNGSTTYTSPVLAQAINGANSTANDARAAVTALDNALTQQEIFNRLTDNGAAQGLVLYNGQLYINAGYVNAGRMNVGRVDFNEPESYYDVPNENDPDSLLSGQTVADGWIVNTSGSGNITVFFCGFAIPLRGKTVTVTFAFNGTLSGGENFWTSLSDEALEMGTYQDWEMPSGTTPNPYTYSVAVPDDAMSFSIDMDCDGVKQIEVSLDSPVTPSESIVYNYEGQRIGEANKFRVYRDGTLITSAKSLFNGVARISKLYLNFPLAVDSGGTGATNAASARANIGALAKEIDRATFSDLNNRALVGHAVLTNDPNYTGRGYVVNVPPGMRTGSKWYDVYLFGDIQMAIGYSEQGTFWVRTYTNGGWTSWHLIGGPSITGSVTSGGAGTLATNSIVRSGNVCTINAWMIMSATLPGQNGLFGTVPDGFRPAVNQFVPCFVSSLGMMHHCRVQPNGEIRTATTSATYAASGYIYLSGSYII